MPTTTRVKATVMFPVYLDDTFDIKPGDTEDDLRERVKERARSFLQETQSRDGCVTESESHPGLEE